ncbi:MAG: MATE family efflux transporter [Saprospiraceae bacterium]
MSEISQSLKVDTSLKAILLLAVPISLSKFIPEVNYLINASFLGHLGTVELAALGITGVYYLIFGAIGYGMNSAILSIMSRKAGEENRTEMRSYLGHGMLLSVGLAIAAILLTYSLFRPFLHLINLNEHVIDLSSDFIHIRIFGLLFMYALNIQISYLISMQRTNFLIAIALIESTVNVALDYGLIFGNFGLPRLGFTGAAWASVIAEIVGLLTVYIILRVSVKEKMYDFKVSYEKLKTALKLGFPLMSQYAISTGSWWIFFLMISRQYSVTDQAISQVMRNFFGLSGVFTWAFGSATNTIVSNLIGQGREEQIFPILKKIQSISLGGVLIYLLCVNIFSSSFLTVFGQGVDFVDGALTPMRIVSLAIIIQTFGVIWLNGVVATGMTKLVFWIEFAGILAYLVYIYIVIDVLRLPFPIAWMSEWLYWTVMVGLSVWYLKRGNWRQGLNFY